MQTGSDLIACCCCYCVQTNRTEQDGRKRRGADCVQGLLESKAAFAQIFPVVEKSEQKHHLEFSRIRIAVQKVAAMSDSEDKAEATAVKAEDAAEKKEAEKNGDAKPKAEADGAKKSDDDAKKEPVADVKKEEKKDDDDGKEDSKKVTSAELRKRITAILKEADLEKTSAKKVGELLEGDGIGKMI